MREPFVPKVQGAPDSLRRPRHPRRLREQYFDVSPQTTITEDNAHLSIDFLVYTKIGDALPRVLNVKDYLGAARGIAITTLRAVVGSMILHDVLAEWEEINAGPSRTRRGA